MAGAIFIVFAALAAVGANGGVEGKPFVHAEGPAQTIVRGTLGMSYIPQDFFSFRSIKVVLSSLCHEKNEVLKGTDIDVAHKTQQEMTELTFELTLGDVLSVDEDCEYFLTATTDFTIMRVHPRSFYRRATFEASVPVDVGSAANNIIVQDLILDLAPRSVVVKGSVSWFDISIQRERRPGSKIYFSLANERDSNPAIFQSFVLLAGKSREEKLLFEFAIDGPLDRIEEYVLNIFDFGKTRFSIPLTNFESKVSQDHLEITTYSYDAFVGYPSHTVLKGSISWEDSALLPETVGDDKFFRIKVVNTLTEAEVKSIELEVAGKTREELAKLTYELDYDGEFHGPDIVYIRYQSNINLNDGDSDREWNILPKFAMERTELSEDSLSGNVITYTVDDVRIPTNTLRITP